MSVAAKHPPSPRTVDRRSARLAWTAVASIPVMFFVAFVLGEVLYEAFGYKPENDDAPLWADLIVSVAALAVSEVPCIGAVVNGWHAHTSGDGWAWVPAVIGALAGVALVTLTAFNM